MNPLLSGLTTFGLRVVESAHLTETVEDWSGVRSPSRAARRLKQGHPQRIVTRTIPLRGSVQIGGVIYMHPATAAEMRRQLAAKADMTFRDAIYGVRGW